MCNEKPSLQQHLAKCHAEWKNVPQPATPVSDFIDDAKAALATLKAELKSDLRQSFRLLRPTR